MFERWAEQRQQSAVERIHQAGGYVYDVTFTDMARRAGSVVANQTVYLLEYPLGRVAIDAPAYPLGLIARVVVLALLGLGLAIVLDRRRAAHKQRRQAGSMQPGGAA
jgi:hypothetical protein